MAPNVEFFAKKRVWSVVKDELLRCYLVPYCAKILSTGNPLLYIDCFAGRGNFDDGNNGSPIIALIFFKIIYKNLLYDLIKILSPPISLN